MHKKFLRVSAALAIMVVTGALLANKLSPANASRETRLWAEYYREEGNATRNPIRYSRMVTRMTEHDLRNGIQHVWWDHHYKKGEDGVWKWEYDGSYSGLYGKYGDKAAADARVDAFNRAVEALRSYIALKEQYPSPDSPRPTKAELARIEWAAKYAQAS